MEPLTGWGSPSWETRSRSPLSAVRSPPLPAAPCPLVTPTTSAACLRAPLVRSFSTRTAVALNSAVPDRGSVASIVSTLVSTWSGKWNVMNASPSRSPVSIRAGASTAPRREVTSTSSPSSIPSASASSGDRSRDSPRCSGELYMFDCAPVL